MWKYTLSKCKLRAKYTWFVISGIQIYSNDSLLLLLFKYKTFNLIVGKSGSTGQLFCPGVGLLSSTHPRSSHAGFEPRTFWFEVQTFYLKFMKQSKVMTSDFSWNPYFHSCLNEIWVLESMFIFDEVLYFSIFDMQ